VGSKSETDINKKGLLGLLTSCRRQLPKALSFPLSGPETGTGVSSITPNKLLRRWLRADHIAEDSLLNASEGNQEWLLQGLFPPAKARLRHRTRILHRGRSRWLPR
jgi:hypothetical protein